MSHCSVIAVHLGAGPPCSIAKRAVYEKICRSACKSALKILENCGSAVDAVCEAVRMLEDSPYTNAGVGSNLTLCGKVECDASVMDGRTLNFGAVGALPDMKNPILVAKSVLQEQDCGLLSLGRIPPCLIVSEGAKLWALEHGFSSAECEMMISRKARRIHQKHRQSLGSPVPRKVACLDVQSVPSSKCDQHTVSLDTIGAVCIDSFGNVASATSSGGLILKHSGRVGQAAIHGAGCWAENGFLNNTISNHSDVNKNYGCQNTSEMSCCQKGTDICTKRDVNHCTDQDSVKDTDVNTSSHSSVSEMCSTSGSCRYRHCPDTVLNHSQGSNNHPPSPSIAVVTTGVGENLIKTMFSHECAQAVKLSEDPRAALENVFEQKFLKSQFLKQNQEKLAGVLILRYDGEMTEVLVGHTTASMCFGVAQQRSNIVKVNVSMLPAGLQAGTCVQIQGVLIKGQ